MLIDYPYFYGIDGKSASVMMDENRWETPRTYFMKIKGELSTDPSEPAYWGKVLKTPIMNEFEKRNKMKVHETENVLYAHPDYDFIIAYINYVIPDEHAILIPKTTNIFLKKDWEMGNVPREAFIEAQHDLTVTGMKKVYIALLMGGNKYYQAEIERDENAIEEIISKEVRFYEETILKNTVPPFRGTKYEEDAVDSLYTTDESDEEVLELDDKYDLKIEEKLRENEKKSKSENLIKKCNSEIKFKMGSKSLASTKNYNIKISTYPRKSVDYDGLVKEFPEAEKYINKTTVKKIIISKKRTGREENDG
jgi:predicted phage-related endonuclease